MKKKIIAKEVYKEEKINAIIYSIKPSQIKPNPSQPRTEFDIKEIGKLADSIRRYGLLQPLSVREIEHYNNKRGNEPLYELVAGERRFRACKMLGMEHIPCIIINATDESSAELAIIENLLRKNLNFFEQAQAFSRLSTVFCLTQEEIAAKMSLSQSSVANKLRLLKLTQEEQTVIINSELSERHARALLRITDPNERRQALEQIILNKFNVSQTEKYISELLCSTSEPLQERPEMVYTPEKICASIYKYIAKLQKESKNLIINRRSDDKSITITLTVRKNA